MDIVSVKWSGGCGVLRAVFPVVVAYLFVRWVRRGTCGLETFVRGWIIPEHRSPVSVALTTTAAMDLAMAAVMTLLCSFDYLIIRLFDSLILCLFVLSVGRWGDRTCRQCCGSTDTAALGEYYATSSSRAKIDSSLLDLFSSFLFSSTLFSSILFSLLVYTGNDIFIRESPSWLIFMYQFWWSQRPCVCPCHVLSSVGVRVLQKIYFFIYLCHNRFWNCSCDTLMYNDYHWLIEITITTKTIKVNILETTSSLSGTTGRASAVIINTSN